MKLKILGLGTAGLLALALVGAACSNADSGPDQTNAELRGGHKADAQVPASDSGKKPPKVEDTDADVDEDSDEGTDESADADADVDEDSDAAVDEDDEVDEDADSDESGKPDAGKGSGKDHPKPVK